MTNQKINRVSGYVMLGLSLFAMFLVVGATGLTLLGKFNPAPGGDEGTAAHLFQLAIVLIPPAGLAFLVTADWRRPLKVAAWYPPAFAGRSPTTFHFSPSALVAQIVAPTRRSLTPILLMPPRMEQANPHRACSLFTIPSEPKQLPGKE